MDILALGSFALDLSRCELRRDGEIVPVQRKVFDLLAYLARHPDRLVSREELLRCVWADATVSATSLSRTLVAVRRALGDDSRDARWIATVHGRGYRFVGRVERDAQRARAASRSEASDQVSRQAHYRSWLLGFDHQRKTLRDAIHAVRDGLGTLALIEGAAGSGKSRLLEWCASEARDHGLRAAKVGFGDPPEIAPGESWARIVAQLDGGAADVSGADPPLAPCSIVESIVAHAAESAVALLLDDVHLAQRDGLAALDALCQQLPGLPAIVVASIGTLRGSRSAELLRLTRHRACLTVSLDGLSFEDVATLTAAAWPEADAAALARHIWQRTAGHPFYVHQLLPLASLQQASEGGAEIALPRSVRAAIEGTLACLSEAELHHLRVASVLGSEISASVVATVGSAPLEAVLDAFDRAVDAGVLRLRPHEPMAYRFSQPIVRDTLYQGLATHDRVVLHARVAEALDCQPDTDATLAGAVAEHLARSGTDAARARECYVRAAEHAETRRCWESAAGAYRSALALCPAGCDAESSMRPRLLRRLAGPTRSLGRLTQAGELLVDAFVAARAMGDWSECAQIVLELWSLHDGIDRRDCHHRRTMTEEVLAHSEAVSPQTRARLLARRAHALANAFQATDRALAEAERAASAAQSSLALAECSIARFASLDSTPHAERRLAHLDEAVQHALCASESVVVQTLRTHRTNELAALGRFRQLDVELGALAREGRRLDSRELRVFLARARCMRAAMNGDFARAYALNDEAHVELGTADASMLRDLDSQRLAIDFDAGRLEDPPLPRPEQGGNLTLALGALYAMHELGRSSEAPPILEYVLRSDLARSHTWNWLFCSSMLAHAVACSGTRDRVEAARARLLGFEDLHVTAGVSHVYFGPVRRYTGLLEIALGRALVGMADLEVALDDTVAIGAHPWSARLQVDLAVAHVALGTSESRREAKSRATRAREIAHDLGMTHVAARARDVLARVR